MHPDKEAFEKGIDDAPLESTNHYVYADWLREHGHEDEADFRQAMGDWVQKPDIGVPTPYSSTGWLAGGKLGYPNGVALSNMDFPRQAGYPQAPAINPLTAKSHHPTEHRNRDEGDTLSGRYHLGFSDYRSMEEAFRRAFMTGRKAKMSRILRARRFSRRIR